LSRKVFVSSFADFGASLLVSLHSVERLSQLIDQFGGHTREVVDEIERVFDLVGNPGSQLAERRKLLCLDKAILRCPQVLQRFRKFAGAPLFRLKQPHVLDSDRCLIRERGDQRYLFVSERLHFRAR
jgi:hypothetical protein